jgi:hypothetical protein
MLGLSVGGSGCDRISEIWPQEGDESDTADSSEDVEDTEAPENSADSDTSEDATIVEPIDPDDPDSDAAANGQESPSSSPQPDFSPSASGESAPFNNQAFTEEAGDPNVLSQIFRDQGGQIAIATPNDWINTNTLHPSAEIQLVNSNQELYFIVLGDSRPNSQTRGLFEQAELYRQQFVEGIANPERTERPNITNINGYDAVQYQIQGEVNDVPITYLHTTVAAPNAYYQLLGWTVSDRFEQHQRELLNITQSFEPFNRQQL